LLIGWFRYELERTAQKINLLHIQKIARSAGSTVLPAILLFATPDQLMREKMIQHRYMVIGYTAVWTIYGSYLLYLFLKLKALQREGESLGL